jgi:uncharacterized protein YjlB
MIEFDRRYFNGLLMALGLAGTTPALGQAGRDAPRPAMSARMQDLPFPASDPVSGRNGSLPSLWRPA